MGNLFTKSKKRKAEESVTEADRAVLSLKTQRRKLNGERKRLEEVIEKNVAVIKELLSKKEKDKALLALKKKKMRDQQLKSTDNWLLHVEELLSTIEVSQQQTAIFAALRSGANALKEIQKEVRIEDVDKLTQDTEEAKAYLDEIHEVLGQSSAEDINELEEELKQLEQQMQEEETLSLPTVPVTKVQKPEVEEEATRDESDSRPAEAQLAV